MAHSLYHHVEQSGGGCCLSRLDQHSRTFWQRAKRHPEFADVFHLWRIHILVLVSHLSHFCSDLMSPRVLPSLTIGELSLFLIHTHYYPMVGQVEWSI